MSAKRASPVCTASRQIYPPDFGCSLPLGQVFLTIHPTVPVIAMLCASARWPGCVATSNPIRKNTPSVSADSASRRFRHYMRERLPIAHVHGVHPTTRRSYRPMNVSIWHSCPPPINLSNKIQAGQLQDSRRANHTTRKRLLMPPSPSNAQLLRKSAEHFILTPANRPRPNARRLSRRHAAQQLLFNDSKPKPPKRAKHLTSDGGIDKPAAAPARQTIFATRFFIEAVRKPTHHPRPRGRTRRRSSDPLTPLSSSKRRLPHAFQCEYR